MFHKRSYSREKPFEMTCNWTASLKQQFFSIQLLQQTKQIIGNPNAHAFGFRIIYQNHATPAFFLSIYLDLCNDIVLLNLSCTIYQYNQIFIKLWKSLHFWWNHDHITGCFGILYAFINKQFHKIVFSVERLYSVLFQEMSISF